MPQYLLGSDKICSKFLREFPEFNGCYRLADLRFWINKKYFAFRKLSGDSVKSSPYSPGKALKALEYSTGN